MAQERVPGMTLDVIIEDVKRSILEYISLYSDLRSICLVSHAWNYVATQSLYTNIVIDIRFIDEQLSVFQRCLQSGASAHLQYARSLTLLDVSADMYYPGLGQFYVDQESETWRKTGEKDRLLLRVLKVFPENKLRVFRYFSDSSIHSALLDHINKHQTSIHTTHVTRCDPHQLASPSQRNILVGFMRTDDKYGQFFKFAQALPPLESLSLVFYKDWARDDLFAKRKFTSNPPNYRKVMTRELLVGGPKPEDFAWAMPRIFDLSMITKLALIECDKWQFRDLSRSPELRNLTRFEFKPLAYLIESDYKFFKDFFQQNQDLQHVYLSYEGLARTDMEFQSTTSYLWPLESRLKTLSLYEYGLERMMSRHAQESEGFPSDISLEYLCREACNLEQLGLQPPKPGLFSASQVNIEDEPLFQYLEPIKRLTRLRVLHLYLDRIRLLFPSPFRSNDEVAVEVCRFATRLFQEMHPHCPDFKALVWGVDGEPYTGEFQKHLSKTTFDRLGIDQNSQLCFVKQEERLADGLLQIRAVCVTLSRLRDAFPSLEMIAYDPRQGIVEYMHPLPYPRRFPRGKKAVSG